MIFFDCCYKCVPPKRYPGCSAKCPEYKERRAKWDANVARERKRTSVPPAKTDYYSKAVWRTKKN